MDEVFEGGCGCRAVRYQMRARPLIVHACHCRWCQRETGPAFALNALIESIRLSRQGDVETIDTPSASGQGQWIVRCPTCRIALWSHYPRAREALSFIRVGTLDDPDAFPPDVHIYTRSKQPWVVLPPGARAFEEFYDLRTTWAPDSLARLQAAMAERR